MRLAFLLAIAFVINGCHILDPLNYDSEVGVPEGTPAERRAWGEKHLGISYRRAIDWISQAQVIQQNLGTVTEIAPIGKPNYVESYFTDGLFGNHTIEITGNKDQGVLVLNGVAPCSYKKLIYSCFKEGILSTKYRRIPVHFLGVTEVEFNRIDNKDKIAELTKKIEQARNPQTEAAARTLENLLIERYRLHKQNEDFENAILDLKSAIALIPKDFNDSSTYKELEERAEDNARRFDRYQYWLATSYYDAGQFAQAANLYQYYLELKSSRGLNLYLDERELWLWFVRKRANQSLIADQGLKNSLTIAQERQKLCYAVYAEYLLGEINSATLIEQSVTPVAKSCLQTTKQRKNLAYFYIAQKEILTDKIYSGREYLHKFIENSHLARGSMEYYKAVKELSRVLESKSSTPK